MGLTGTNTSSPIVAACYSASDIHSGVAELRVGEDITNATWRAFTVGMCEDQTLSAGDGVKTLKAQFRDLVGNPSLVASDSIILDTTLPRLKDLSPTGTIAIAPAPTVSAKWEDDTTTGPGTGIWFSKSRIWWTDRNAGQTVEVTNLPTMTRTATGFSYRPGALSPANEYTVLVRFQDGAGNQAEDGWSFRT